MVEKVSGERLKKYLHEHIFGPLGMADTSLKVSPSQRERLLAMHARAPTAH
jgi:CubicO group peptidase (beta-lactamase class C family)